MALKAWMERLTRRDYVGRSTFGRLAAKRVRFTVKLRGILHAVKGLRRALHRVLEVDYDRRVNRKARTVLEQLRLQGLATMTPRLRRDVNAYAREVLGSRAFAPWLGVFAAVRGEVIEGLIPENFMGRVVVPHVNGRLRFVGDPKAFTKAVFDEPSIPDVAYLIKGRFFDDRRQPLVGSSEVRSALFRDGDEVVFKVDVSEGGMGTELLHVDRFDADAVAVGARDGVFQRRILQHPEFSLLGSQSGATLRITTYVTRTGSVRAAVSTVNAPQKGALMYRVGRGVGVLVDADRGVYRPHGVLSANMRFFDRVPGGFPPFGGVPVPGFGAARDLALGLHRRVPHLGLIGWDFVVDGDERPWLIEWNTRHPGSTATEMLYGPSWKETDWSSLRPLPYAWLV